MKTFFILILLTNIVFAVMQWLFPYEQLFVKSRPLIAAEPLRMLVEPEVSAISNQSDDIGGEGVLPVLTQPVSGKLCYTLGPFKDNQLVQEVVSSFKQNKIKLTSRPSVEKEYMGMMVYIDGHDTRNDARSTAKSLAEKGIRDYMIVSEENKTNALSLGVFGLKKNADRRVEQISKLGYQVKSEARYRNRTIYWLDYSNKENEFLSDLIARLKSQQGVSRISRLCG